MTKREFLKAGIGGRVGARRKDCRIFAAIAAGRASRTAEGENDEAVQEPARVSQRDRGHAGGTVDRRAEALGRASRLVSPARTEVADRSRLAGRLERQAAEDGDHSFPKHQRDGRRRRICLDGRECASGRRFSGGHEFPAGQPPPDSARSGQRRRRLPRRSLAGRQAVDRVTAAARQSSRGSRKPGSRNS